jgi:hypothetical protein
MSEWMPIETLPPIGERPGRVFALVQGEKHHSGVRWHRIEFGIAATWNDGIEEADVRLIEKRGDMDPHTGTVTHWLPINLPPFPQPVK